MIKFFNLIGLATAAAAVVALTQDVSAAVLSCTADDRVTIFVRNSSSMDDQQTKGNDAI
ncbi:MAG: hypothetical protein ACKVLA_04135 [Rhodobacterales bacterium]